MRILSGVVVAMSFAVPAVAQRTIVCTSSGNARQVCPANTQNGVVLTRERSDGVCRQGSTWGYNTRGIFVSGGCSAEFQVGGSGNGDQNGNAYGNNGDRSQGGSGSNGNQNGYGNNGNQNGYGNNGNQNGYGKNGNQNGYGNNGQRRGGVIPAGTRMDVRLEQTVRPNSAQQGDEVSGVLADDVVVNGNTLATAGTPVQLRVTTAQTGQAGSLSLQLASISMNGQQYRLSSNSIHSGRDNQAQRDGNNGDANGGNGGNVLGSVMGAINSARNTGELARGSVFTFRTTGTARAGGSGGQRNEQ